MGGEMLVGLDIKEAATTLGVRPATVLRRIQKGLLKAVVIELTEQG